tara:strand:- start:2876 stop:4066 length:1191 start_codon:yes stop_codon:yes gene_type:complete
MEGLLKWAKDAKRSKLVNALEELHAMVGMDKIKANVCSQVKRHIMVEKYESSKKVDHSALPTPPLTRAAKRRKSKPRRRTNWTRPKRHRSPIPPTSRSRQRTTAGESTEAEDPASVLKNLIVIRLLQAAHDEDDEDDEEWTEFEDSDDDEGGSVHNPKPKYHTLLLGPPGCGKTTVAYLIRNVWRAAGVCNDKFDTIGRTHVMSKWQGEASEKIRRKIEDCHGGVLFVDECYGLVQGSNDTYGNEVLTAIVQAMTDHRCTTTFILAGYEKETKAKLFGANCGLERRFDAIYSIKKSSEAQLVAIFKSKNKLAEWAEETDVDEVVEKLCKKHGEKLAFGGGDVMRLLEECHRAHMDRFFPETMDCKLTAGDVQEGFRQFLRNTDKKDKDFSNRYMYL